MILKGKHILFLGSSVTYGSAAGGISFADLIAETTECVILKEAVSGTTLADVDEGSYVNRLKKWDASIKVDAVICQLSTNDAGRGIALKQVEAAIRFIAAYTEQTWHCPLHFYTGTYFESEAYRNMVELLLKLQKELGFGVLDLYHDAAMRAVSPEDYSRYMEDPVHPRLEGYRQWWTPVFLAYLEAL